MSGTEREKMERPVNEVEAVPSEVLGVVIPSALSAIGNLIRIQDNRITDCPLFIVQKKGARLWIRPTPYR